MNIINFLRSKIQSSKNNLATLSQQAGKNMPAKLQASEKTRVKESLNVVRRIVDSDTQSLIKLFKLNYGNSHPNPRIFDEVWVRRSIYSENTLWLGIEEQGEIAACGALLLDYGRPVDQVGEMGRLAVHPEMAKHGLARRIIEVLSEESGKNVEMTCGYARTAHSISQKLMEETAFSPIGFLPQRWVVCERQESAVIYGRLSDTARQMRSSDMPQVMPEIAEFARHSMAAFKVGQSLKVVEKCGVLPEESGCGIKPLERKAIPQLMRIELGRVTRPMVFGNASLEYGLPATSRRETKYLMAVSRNKAPVGGVGYQVDKINGVASIVELFAQGENIAGDLIRNVITKLSGEKIIEANISAYEPKLQQTFWNHGFRPTAYVPAHAFHRTQRLDAVKMYKLNIPYNGSGLRLTEKAMAVASIVGNYFTPEKARPERESGVQDSPDSQRARSVDRSRATPSTDSYAARLNNRGLPMEERLSAIDPIQARRYNRLTGEALEVASDAIRRHLRACDRTDVNPDPSAIRQIIEDALQGRRVIIEARSMQTRMIEPSPEVDEAAIWFPSFD
jgi:N-acetylglutamate synthase-like GNAT family acetyltransferase